MTENHTPFITGLHHVEFEEYTLLHANAMASQRAWAVATAQATLQARKETADKTTQKALIPQYRMVHLSILEPEYLADKEAIGAHRANLCGLWNAFADAHKDKLDDINLLHDAALRKNGIKEAANIADISSRLETAALALSDFTKPAPNRDLVSILGDTLFKQWIELEKQYDLFPPPNMKVTESEKEEIFIKRQKLLASPEGKLLSDTLWHLSHGLVQSHVTLTLVKSQRNNKNISREDVTAAAYSVFIATLFAHEEKHKASFRTHLYDNLKIGLPTYLLKELGLHSKNDRRRMKSVSLDSAYGNDDAGSLLQMLAAPDEKNLASEMDSLRSIIERAGLNPNQQKVIEARFGLNGSDKQTLATVAQSMGVCHERARQIEVAALKKLQAASRPGFVARIPPPQKAPLNDNIVRCKQRLRKLLLGEPDKGTITIAHLSSEIDVQDSRITTLIGNGSGEEYRLRNVLSDNMCATLNIYLLSQDRPAAEIEEFNQLFAELRELTGWKSRAEKSAVAMH